MTAAPPPNPFREIIVGCPICGEASTHLRLKPRLFAERERDIDMRTTVYWWSNRELTRHHPPLYYVWQCPQCYFAAAHKFFEQPAEHFAAGFKKLKEALQTALTGDPRVYKVVAAMTRAKASETLDFYEAIRLHLLAIFELMAVGESAREEMLTIARYCLRLGWLYCDLADRPKERKAVELKLARLAAPVSDAWPEIPLDYRQAYELAIKYYEQAFIGSYAIERAIDEVELQLLVARLHLKLGQVPAAQELIFRSRESAKRYEAAKLKERRQLQEIDKDFSDQEAFDVSATLRRMRIQTEQVQALFEQIREKYDAEESSRAEQLIGQNAEASADELKQKLLKAGIRETIAIKTIQTHEHRRAKGKKGMLDIFK